MSAGGPKGPSGTETRLLEEEKARQAELRRQAELARMSRGRRLASVSGEEVGSATILGSGGRFSPGP